MKNFGKRDNFIPVITNPRMPEGGDRAERTNADAMDQPVDRIPVPRAVVPAQQANIAAQLRERTLRQIDPNPPQPPFEPLVEAILKQILGIPFEQFLSLQFGVGVD